MYGCRVAGYIDVWVSYGWDHRCMGVVAGIDVWVWLDIIDVWVSCGWDIIDVWVSCGWIS